MTHTQTNPLQYAQDVAGLRLQLGQAVIALAMIESETRGPMRQSELLAIIQNQLCNINTAADSPAF